MPGCVVRALSQLCLTASVQAAFGALLGVAVAVLRFDSTLPEKHSLQTRSMYCFDPFRITSI